MIRGAMPAFEVRVYRDRDLPGLLGRTNRATGDIELAHGAPDWVVLHELLHAGLATIHGVEEPVWEEAALRRLSSHLKELARRR